MNTIKIILASLALLIALQADAQLDSTFGVDGSVYINFFGRLDSLTRVRVQPDGKILVTGFASRGLDIISGMDSSMTVLVRLKGDGTPDSSFGTDGKVITAISNRSQPNDLAVQPDGKIVLAGIIDSPTLAFAHEAAILRYLSDGRPDPTFGTGGRVLTTRFGADTLRGFSAVCIDQQGGILVGSEVSTNYTQLIYRYNPDGSPDMTFVTPRLRYSHMLKFYVMSDGKITALITNMYNNANTSLIRLKATGSPDSTFGVNGIADLQFPAVDFVIQSDGSIALCGLYGRPVKVSATGVLDQSFGTSGIGAPYLVGGDGFAVAIQADSRIIVSCYSYNPVQSTPKAQLARYTSSGILDSGFGTAGGYVVAGADSATWTRGSSLCVQADQKILAGSTSAEGNVIQNTFLVQRLDAGLSPDSTVWPGDADAGHYVDHTDLLPIGLAYGSTGPVRTAQGIVWQAYPAADWSSSFTTYAPSVNYKHADCNGDGTIDALDTNAIAQNYGLIHSKTEAGTPWRTGVPGITIHYAQDTLLAGDTLLTDLQLGDTATPAADIYGLAFTYHFDPLITDASSVSFDFDPGWFGIGTPTISIHRTFPAYGTIQAAITGIDHQGHSGSGLIAHVRSVITTDNINGKDLSYYTNSSYISDITAVDPQGHRLDINAGSATDQVGFEPTGISDVSTERISLYPNPAATQVTVTAQLGIGQIAITDMLGQQVLTAKGHGAQSQSIDVSSFAPGVYSVHISTQTGSGTSRLIITR